MPRARKTRKAAAPLKAEIPPLALWFMREVLPRLRRRRTPSRSARHLKNAGIEVLEAMRVLLDESIEWLREEDRSTPMKRIEVDD